MGYHVANFYGTLWLECAPRPPPTTRAPAPPATAQTSTLETLLRSPPPSLDATARKTSALPRPRAPMPLLDLPRLLLDPGHHLVARVYVTSDKMLHGFGSSPGSPWSCRALPSLPDWSRCRYPIRPAPQSPRLFVVMAGRSAGLQNRSRFKAWNNPLGLNTANSRLCVAGKQWSRGRKRPLIRPATAGENACRGPPSPLGEGNKSFSRGAHAPKEQFPSPQGRGGTAKRRAPHVLQVVGVRGHFPDSSAIDFMAPTIVRTNSSGCSSTIAFGMRNNRMPRVRK